MSLGPVLSAALLDATIHAADVAKSHRAVGVTLAVLSSLMIGSS